MPRVSLEMLNRSPSLPTPPPRFPEIPTSVDLLAVVLDDVLDGAVDLLVVVAALVLVIVRRAVGSSFLQAERLTDKILQSLVDVAILLFCGCLGLALAYSDGAQVLRRKVPGGEDGGGGLGAWRGRWKVENNENTNLKPAQPAMGVLDSSEMVLTTFAKSDA